MNPSPQALLWHVSQCILSWSSRIHMHGLWLGISTYFKIILLMYTGNNWGKDDPRDTFFNILFQQLSITIKTKYGFWVGIWTIFKIISNLYNKGLGDDPWGTCLTYKSMHLILLKESCNLSVLLANPIKTSNVRLILPLCQSKWPVDVDITTCIKYEND